MKNPISNIACIKTESGKLLGTAFLLSSNILITCYHVFKDESAALDCRFIVEWPEIKFSTTAIISAIDYYLDTVILNCSDWPSNVNIHKFKINLEYEKTSFFSFGFRKSNYFIGLHAEGTILGVTSRKINQSAVRLIQLKSDDIDYGMSGAPVFINDKDEILLLGMITSFWETERLVDTGLAFAIPIEEILKFINKEMPQFQQKLLKSEDKLNISLLYKYCSILLILEKFYDGAYARSLWRCGGKDFTEDTGDHELIKKLRMKKAISVTSWAAQALFKAFGFGLRNILEQSVNYILSHYDSGTGTFGNVYNISPSNPYAQTENGFIPNPRHTASAIKLLIQLGIYNRVVCNGLLFLIKTQCPNGSWGETPWHEGNSLATAYVLDCLSLINNDLTLFEPAFDPTEYKYFIKMFSPSIEKGFSALAGMINNDGSWSYRDIDIKPEMRIYYTAHVWAFLPQLFKKFPHLIEMAITYLKKQQNKDGGFPAHEKGKSALAPTSMFLYGIAKSELTHCEDIKMKALGFLTSIVPKSGEELIPLNIFDTTFTLLLTQIPEYCNLSWQDDTLELINQLYEKILNIDDSLENRESFINSARDFLRERGYSVNCAVEFIGGNQ